MISSHSFDDGEYDTAGCSPIGPEGYEQKTPIPTFSLGTQTGRAIFPEIFEATRLRKVVTKSTKEITRLQNALKHANSVITDVKREKTKLGRELGNVSQEKKVLLACLKKEHAIQKTLNFKLKSTQNDNKTLRKWKVTGVVFSVACTAVCALKIIQYLRK